MKKNHSDTMAHNGDTTIAVRAELPPMTSKSKASSASPIETNPPPPSLAQQYSHVMSALEDVERKFRLKYHPSLTERADPLEVDDLKDMHMPHQRNQYLQSTEQEQPGNQYRESTQQTTEFGKTIIISNDGTTASLRKRGLKEIFRITDSILPFDSTIVFENLLTLDVSHNELTDLPGLSALKNLRALDLNRNWFNTLPSEIGALAQLETLVAARNFLKPNHQSLRLETLKTNCPRLHTLDLRYNQKCCRPLHRDRLEEALLPLKPKITMTLWEEEIHGNNNNNNSASSTNCNNYVGSSAAQRDPVLLRSQLEPLGTVALRKRLVCDFGREPTDPAKVDRSGVMRDLLEAYFEEGLAYFPESNNPMSDVSNGESQTVNYDSLIANRKTLQLYGSKVPEEKLERLMVELKKWTDHTGLINKNRERPSIHASNYMILRKPPPMNEMDTIDGTSNNGNGKPLSRRALRKIQKRERYRRLWEAGIDALNCVDPVYAEKNCTEIAITHGFSGSPHRDKQNCGPFYGLSLGNYDDSCGKGGIVVEASARVVVQVNTKGRLGRVDGRYVHWVAPWDKHLPHEQEEQPAAQQEQQRYSLIYYETGHEFVAPGPAVFSIPKDASSAVDIATDE